MDKYDADQAEEHRKSSTVNSIATMQTEILHMAFDLILPLYDGDGHATTYRDYVALVLSTLRQALEKTDHPIGKPIPYGWCICGSAQSLKYKF